MSVNITATRRRSNATTTTRSSQRRHGRANPAEQRASSSLPAKRGSPQLGSACTSQARHANSRDKGTPARARKCPRVPDVCKVGKGKRHLQGFPRKPSDGLEPSTPSLPSSANRAKWGAAYASRGVARVVSDVSVLCPRAVVRLGNSLGAFVRRPTSGVTGWPCCFRSGRYWDALSRCESDGEHNFAARAPGAEILHRLCSLAQWERPVDDGRDLPPPYHWRARSSTRDHVFSCKSPFRGVSFVPAHASRAQRDAPVSYPRLDSLSVCKTERGRAWNGRSATRRLRVGV
jgi:hypothetical protein